MKILITGGSGYVGSKLVSALKNHEVEVFDKPKDILNKDELGQAVKGKDIVYHLAALAGIDYTEAHPEETFEVNIKGTNNVCEACVKHNVLLNFISTCCIYGEPLEVPSVEDSLINPTDTYAFSKASAEWLVKMWNEARDLKYNIIRLGTIYGPSTDKSMRLDMCIQEFLKAGIEKRGFTMTGDGKQGRNFLYIDDAVSGFLAIIGTEGETINLAGKEYITINQLANWAITKYGALGYTTSPPRKGDFIKQNVSINKAKRLLNWEPKVKFEDGLERFHEWLK